MGGLGMEQFRGDTLGVDETPREVALHVCAVVSQHLPDRADYMPVLQALLTPPRSTAEVAEPVRELQPCGTDAAYQRHQKHGEPVDDACRLAHNRERAARKQRAAAKAEAA